MAGGSTGGTGCGMCRALRTRGPHDLQHGAARDARNGLWRRGLRLKHGAVMGSRTAKEVAQIIGRERCRDRRHHEHQQSHAADAEKRGRAWSHGLINSTAEAHLLRPRLGQKRCRQSHAVLPHTPAVRAAPQSAHGSQALLSRPRTKAMGQTLTSGYQRQCRRSPCAEGARGHAGLAAAAIQGRTTFTKTVYNRSGRRPDARTDADEEPADQEHVADAALLLEGAEDVRDEHRRCAPGLPRRA